MLFTEKQFHKAFYDWMNIYFQANYVESIPIQKLNDNGPRPDIPYVSFRIMGFNPIGHYEILKPDNTGTATIKGTVEIPVYFQAHGYNALTYLQQLHRTVYTEEVKQQLYDDVKLSYIQQISPARYVPYLKDGLKFEQRAAMDILFRTHDSFTDDLGNIEIVEIEVDYNDGEYIDNFTVDINS